MAEDALLHIAELGHSFGAVNVLRHVNLDVPRGGVIGLIGPNGSGKTTLFNLISGFIEPVAGSVVFDGRDMRGIPVEGRSRAGLVRTFQTPRVFESMTVLENIMSGCANATPAGIAAEMFALPGVRVARSEMLERGRESCARFGLWGLRDASTKTLPAGQRRVLEIARAVAGRPKLLMLDEPSSGLNHREVKTLEHWIGHLRDDGMAILLVSHDMELMNAVDIVHLLYNGELLVSGSMSRLQNDPRVRDVYLGA